MYLMSHCIYLVFIEQNLFILLQLMLKSYKCIYFLLNVNFIVFIHWMLTLYMYSLKILFTHELI